MLKLPSAMVAVAAILLIEVHQRTLEREYDVEEIRCRTARRLNRGYRYRCP
jgi:hypothetical protein